MWKYPCRDWQVLEEESIKYVTCLTMCINLAEALFLYLLICF